MKLTSNYILLCLALVLATGSYAQVDRSQQPAPGPAPKIALGDYDVFTLKNGLKVIVVENNKLPRVAFRLVIDRDRLMENEKAGYVDVAGTLLRRGTTNRTKEQLDEEIDFIGARLTTNATGIQASALKRHTEKLLALMSDVLLNPSFPQAEFDKIIAQSLSGLKAAKEDPSAIVANLERTVLYGPTHPYGTVTTEATMKNITLQDCQAYYNQWFKPNIAYLVIVGDITTKEAKKLSKQYFGPWQRGEAPTFSYEQPAAPAKTQVALFDRPASVQSVVRVSYPLAIEPGHPDAIKASVTNGILGGGVFAGRRIRKLREENAWTYGANSTIRPDELVGYFRASTNTRNNVTDSAIHVILEEMERLRTEPVDDDALMVMKNFMNGLFALRLERPQTIATYALNIERYNLPKDYYATYLEKLAAVNKADVLAMARKYIKPDQAHIIVVGKSSEVADKLKRFGTVQYYDQNGKPITP